MKKLLHTLCLIVLLSFTLQVSAQRFISNVFTSDTVTHNVLFGWNISIIPTDDEPLGHSTPVGTLYNDSLRADIYEPVGDTMANRPTIIMLHTGSFLPIFYNGQATGQKIDSTIVEMCHQFARRGYTAIAIDYRSGWNPLSTDQEVRTGSLLQAAGRGIQDAKAAVRFFRNNALNGGNTWHIDESKIIMGGAGTGGYIAFGYATIDSYAKISISPKFTATSTNLTYGFFVDSSYFAKSLWGDIDGYGGQPFLNNGNNSPGISNDIHFVFNMGGAMGDSSWLEAGDVPMVCFHVPNDPFAPYNIGNVIVPTTMAIVVEAFGSYYVIDKADTLLNNSSFQFNSWTDVYTTRANAINDGNDGLFPFELPDPPGPAPGQAGPWEWFDSTTVYTICTTAPPFGLGFTQGHTDTIWYSSLATNPEMSRDTAIAYIDTIMGYLNPRIAGALQLPTGLSNPPQLAQEIKIYPNPATTEIQIRSSELGVSKIELYNLLGEKIFEKNNAAKSKVEKINVSNYPAGMYFVKIHLEKGEVIRKISIQ